MTCEAFMHRLQEVLDARVDPAGDELLRGHADGCSQCAAQLARWAAVDAVWHSCEAASRWRRSRVGFAVAATLLAGALGTWVIFGSQQADERLAESAGLDASPSPGTARPVEDPDDLQQMLTTVTGGQLTRWADDAWRPLVEGLRPVTGSLNAAVRAFQPASLHLENPAEDPTSGQVRRMISSGAVVEWC